MTALITEFVFHMSNDDLIDKMRSMRDARSGGVSHVVASLSGFDDDPRELWELPEVRAFCRRLVDLGVVSYLDPFAALNPDPAYPPMLKGGFGAAEVWLTAEGRMRSEMTITRALVVEVAAAIEAANEVADDAIGV